MKSPKGSAPDILMLPQPIWLVPIVLITKSAPLRRYAKNNFMQDKIGHLKVNIFKIKNRLGFAAVCCDHLTEGKSPQEAYTRMVKALRRTNKKEIT